MSRLRAARRQGLDLGRTAARRSVVERWLAPRLAAADLAWPPGLVSRAWAGAAVVAVLVGLRAGGPVLALLSLGIAVGLPPAALAVAGDRRAARLERELPSLLAGVARSLRSGATIPVALREAEAEDLRPVLADVDRGLPLAEALARWTERRPTAGVRLTAGVLTLALAAGGPPARAVDGVAGTLRERAEVDREVRALATQARASAVVITVAPLAFAALGMLGDERTAQFLLRTPTGLACLAAGVALDAVGAWWMARIAAAS